MNKLDEMFNRLFRDCESRDEISREDIHSVIDEFLDTHPQIKDSGSGFAIIPDSYISDLHTLFMTISLLIYELTPGNSTTISIDVLSKHKGHPVPDFRLTVPYHHDDAPMSMDDLLKSLEVLQFQQRKIQHQIDGVIGLQKLLIEHEKK